MVSSPASCQLEEARQWPSASAENRTSARKAAGEEVLGWWGVRGQYRRCQARRHAGGGNVLVVLGGGWLRLALGRRVVLASLVLASVALSDTGPAQGLQRLNLRRPLILGYYVPYDAASWTSLQAHAEQLDIVATQNVSVDACGGLSSRDDLTLSQFVHAHGRLLEPSLFTLSGPLNHRLLTDDETRSGLLQAIVSYTNDVGYDGFDLDLEGVDAGDRAALTDFVATLAAALHDQGKLLTLAVPAKDSDARTGWSGAYDYAALGAQADLVTIMAYEYRGPFSGPGSVAPFDWVHRVVSFAASLIPKDKVLLGLAFYGYDWNVSSGGALAIGYAQLLALANHYEADVGHDSVQRSATFGYEVDAGEPPPAVSAPPQPAHQFSVRQPPPCDLVMPQPTPTPRPAEPEPGVPQAHQVWYEDSASAAARLDLVGGYGISGIATWRLGLEDPNVWPLFEQWRAT